MFCTRSILLPAIFLGAAANLWGLFHVLSLWYHVAAEAESEWEGSGMGDSVRTTCAIAATYLLLASTACIVGFIGVTKRIPSYVRLFLHWSIGDLALYTLVLVVVAFFGFRPSDWRDTACESLSVEQDVLVALSQSGFDLENCEAWVENVVLGILAILCVGLLLKLQFTLATSTYYTTLVRATKHASSLTRSHNSKRHSISSRSRSQSRTMREFIASSRDLPPYSDNASLPEVVVHSPTSPVPDNKDVYELEGSVVGVSTSFEEGKRR